MWPGLQIFEVLLLYSCHHPVVVQVLLHLDVIWVGLEERVGSSHCLVQFIDLKKYKAQSCSALPIRFNPPGKEND